MQTCKFCRSDALRKSGFVRGKQRYFCKLCERNQVIGDERERYSDQIRNTAVTLYLEGCGFRRISRILKQIYRIKIHFQLVSHWIKHLGYKLESSISEPPKRNVVPMLEMDELYTYIRKKGKNSAYGLLLIETGCVLLDLRPVTQVQKL